MVGEEKKEILKGAESQQWKYDQEGQNLCVLLLYESQSFMKTIYIID